MHGLRTGGAMVAVFATEARVREAIGARGERVAIAAINGPEEIVIAGMEGDVRDVVDALADGGTKTRALKTSHAFHSAEMDPALDAIERAASRVRFAPPKTALVSNVTGAATSGAPDAAYFRRHARSPVRFHEGAKSLAAIGCDVFIEVGPHPVLLGLVQRALTDDAAVCLPSLRRDHDDVRQLLASAGAYFVAGGEIDWGAIGRDPKADAPVRRRVSLPTYPFEGERYWIPPTPIAGVGPARGALRAGGLLGRRVRSPRPEIQFEAVVDVDTPPVCEHKIFGAVVVPGAAYVAMILDAARNAFNGGAALEAIAFESPLILGSDGPRVISTSLAPADGDAFAFHIESALERDEASGWTTHGTGRVLRARNDRARVELSQVRARCARAIDASDFAGRTRERGYELGPSFTWLEDVAGGDGEAVARIRAPRAEDRAADFVVHPGIVDACFQLFGITWPEDRAGGAYVPIAIERVDVHGAPSGALSAYARWRPDGASATFTGDVDLIDEDGRVVVAIAGLSVRRAAKIRAGIANQPRAYAVAWVGSSPGVDSLAARKFLIVDGGGDSGSEIAKRLEVRGHTCMRVRAGAAIDAIRELQPAEVAWLWDASPKTSDTYEGDAVASLTIALQAAATAKTPPRIRAVTRGATHAALDVGKLEQAAVWGFSRVAELELPTVWRGVIDLDDSDDPDWDALASELAHEGDETQIALSRGARTTPRLVRRPPLGESEVSLSGDAAYLVTGGLGGLGMCVAAWLVDHGAKHLVLVQRSEASPAAREAIDALAPRARIETARVDVSDRDALAVLIDQMRSHGPPLRGVVHAAGVVDDALILHQSPERLARVMAPKAAGAWNLHTLTQDLSLDFFVLFSSAAALLGSPGQSGYAAANAFVDALAEARHARGLPALSIGWGPWAEVGMAAAARTTGGWIDRGLARMAPAAALDAMGALLHSGDAHAAVLALNPRQLTRAITGPAPRVLVDLLREAAPSPPNHSASATADTTLVDRIACAPATERVTIIRRFVHEQAARVLGFSPNRSLDSRAALQDVGLDSLMAIALTRALGAGIGRALPPALVFNHPSIEALATYIAKEFAPAAEPPPREKPAAATPALTVASVKSLSEEELLSVVSEEIEKLSIS
jgi:acyl transferase domain-containing protein